jgi:hypothetical protein
MKNNGIISVSNGGVGFDIKTFLSSESVKLFEKAIFHIADYPTRVTLTNMFNKLKGELGNLVVDEHVKEVNTVYSDTIQEIGKMAVTPIAKLTKKRK